MSMRSLIAASLVCAAASSNASATILVFTDQFLFDAYTVGAYRSTENFNTYSGFYASPLTGSTGGFNWSAASSGGMYVGAVNGSQALSTNNPAPLTISFSGLTVNGVSGNVFGTDINFSVVPSIVQLSLQDGTSYIAFIDSATAFAGFVSTGASITAITVSAQPLAGGSAVYPTFDNMTLASVPAPGALALLGLAGAAAFRRRR